MDLDLLPKLSQLYQMDYLDLVRYLHDGSSVFVNNQQQEGTFQAATALINNGTEKLDLETRLTAIENFVFKK